MGYLPEYCKEYCGLQFMALIQRGTATIDIQGISKRIRWRQNWITFDLASKEETIVSLNLNCYIHDLPILVLSLCFKT